MEFAVDLDRGLHWGKTTVPYLSPVIDVFQLKKRYINIQLSISQTRQKLYYVYYCIRATCFDSYRIIFRPF